MLEGEEGYDGGVEKILPDKETSVSQSGATRASRAV